MNWKSGIGSNVTNHKVNTSLCGGRVRRVLIIVGFIQFYILISTVSKSEYGLIPHQYYNSPGNDVPIFFKIKYASIIPTTQTVSPKIQVSPILMQPNETCGYILLTPPDGGLGNRMFEYASFYGTLKKYNKSRKISFVFKRTWLDGIFDNLTIPAKDMPEDWVNERNFMFLNEKSCCGYHPDGFENLDCDGKNFYFRGYRQSFKYFQDSLEEIKREFKFNRIILEKSKRRFDDLEMKNCVSVGVHLRRGDYAASNKIKLGYWPAQSDYLQRAVEYFEKYIYHNSPGTSENGTCLIFLIFGNDYEWNLNASQRIQLINPNNSHLIVVDGRNSDAAVDMCTIGLCDHAIISTGTFSWWAGFLNGGMVTYQKEYVRNGSWLQTKYVKEDFYFPNWIAL